MMMTKGCQQSNVTDTATKVMAEKATAMVMTKATAMMLQPPLMPVGRRSTIQLRLLEQYLDVLVKHTTEIPPPTALVEGTAPVCLSRRHNVKMIYFKL